MTTRATQPFERGYRRGIGRGYKVSVETGCLYLRRQVRLLAPDRPEAMSMVWSLSVAKRWPMQSLLALSSAASSPAISRRARR